MRGGILACWILMVAVTADAARIVEHDVNVRLDPATAGVELRDRVTVEFDDGRDGPLNVLLHRDLDLTSVRIGDEELAVKALRRWRPRDFWEKPDFAELGAFGVVRQHRIDPPEAGWPARVELDLEVSGAIYDSLQAPDVAYSRGFETTSGLVDPRGAYLSYETFWIPWSGDGRFAFRLETDLPAAWHSMSQGRRVEHRVVDERNRTVWESEGGQELIYLVAGPYVIREREHRGVKIYTYTYENTPEDLCNTYLDATGAYLDRYGDRFGDYAFSKWAMVENWWQTGYGMPGFTLLGDRVIRLPFIVDTSYGHEILHCWWGNGVYVDYDQGNWCEGLTAYGADYTYKREQSALAARDYRRSTLVGYLDFASAGEKDFPLRDFRERSDYGTQAIGYGKSLMLFHMLQRRIGDDRFRDGLRKLYSENLFEPASWDDLAAAFSDVAGEDLRPWFAQWVDRTGAVKLSIGDVTEEADDVVVEIRQEEPAYAVRVPVTWDEEGVTRRLEVECDAASTTFTLPGSVELVRIDPDYDLFRVLYREEIPPTFSQVLGADSTTVIIGGRNEAAMTEALRAVAESWAQNQDMRIVDEADFLASDHVGRSRFLLGPGALADAAMDEARRVFGDEPADLIDETDAGRSLIACVRDPGEAENAWVVLLPASTEDCEALGRKLPHYSKYSWLLFEGEENVGKGAWTVMSSPLHRGFSEGNGR